MPRMLAEAPHGERPSATESLAASRRPFTPAQALMECRPGDEPEASQLELLVLRDVIADAMDATLTDLEAWIFTECVVARTPLRKLGIPKTTVSRIRDRAAAKLAVALGGHPLVLEHLEDQ